MNAVFKALNDATRRQILHLLQDRDLTAGEIATRFNMSWPSISHHLDLLKQGKLVLAEKEGQYVYYSLNSPAIEDLHKWVQSLKSKKKAS